MVVERQRRRRRVPRPRHRLRRDAAHRLGRAPVQRSGRLRRTSHEAGVHRRAVRSRTAWTTGAPASTPTSPSAPPASSRSGGWKLDFDLPHGRLRLEHHRRPGRPAPPRHQPLLGREHPGRRRRGFRRQCHGGRRRAGFLQPRRCPLRQGLNRAAPFAPGARRAGSVGTSRPRSPLLLLFPRSVNSAETSMSAAVAPSIPVVSGTAWGPGSPPRACPRSRRTTSGRPPPRTGARHGSSPTSADG